MGEQARRNGLNLGVAQSKEEYERVLEYANVKLAFRGCPVHGSEEDYPFLNMGKSLLANFQEKNRLLTDYLCPADQRIQNFLDRYFSDVDMDSPVRVPTNSLILERQGLARMLSVPPDDDRFESEMVTSHRVRQGILHNPKHDRRTTKGVFHVAEGGLPIPGDKKAVPKSVFAELLREAFRPPRELLGLPFTSNQEQQAEILVSLLLRPIVFPDIPGVSHSRSMETRFFAPGGLVSNLDFVESIFGNAGDPYLPDNDAQLDVERWTGQTGCVVLAPHLKCLSKRDLGLPPVSQATERQRRDGMCWEKETELYNDGNDFKITARDKHGVIVTLITDNYFGYCKKEVKTQISFAANLCGTCEEEHSGGAVVFPTYDLGEDFRLSRYYPIVDHTFEEVVRNYSDRMELQPEGYGIDRYYRDIIYVPEDVQIYLREQKIVWKKGERTETIKLLPKRTYVLPSGYKVEMVKPRAARHWRLVGTTAEGTFCHKPCTVSGGGKSEISKPLADAIIGGPVFTADIENDFDQVQEILEKDYSQRFWNPHLNRPHRNRPILSSDRSLGSVIKLLTPSVNYTDEYNEWVRSIPRHIKDLVFVLKRFYRPEWGNDWRRFFSVDVINGMAGNELKYKGQTLITQYLRVGFTSDGLWRTFSLRKDFQPSVKLQMEDDITASAVISSDRLQGLNPKYENPSVKFVVNCENRLFQRPDEAIHRGYDHKTEYDFSKPGNFFSNYEPLTRADAKEIIEDVIHFDEFTGPMQSLISGFVNDNDDGYFISSAHPRLIHGVPSKNPRYLQNRPDLENPRLRYLAELGTRLFRRIPSNAPVPYPVNAVLPGRRNNPPNKEAGIRSLAVYNPVHYQELPELFMDFISSLTGKSPSTTGAGSEGALTKGPFNALLPIVDLNNALVSYLVTDYRGFTTASGHIGPKYQVDHDLSLLIPELWARLGVEERTPAFMLEHGYLEKCEDFEHNGKWVRASRLGYRINENFVRTFFGRVVSNPDAVFTGDMLKPELQDMDAFADGVDNIVETQQQVAKRYFEDGSVEDAVPPLKALLHIMAFGHDEGKGIEAPEIRSLFSRETMLESDWYHRRLQAKQQSDIRYYEQQIRYLRDFLQKESHQREAGRLRIGERLADATRQLERVKSDDYLKELAGSIGTDPSVL